MGRRFFQSFKQSIECFFGQHMDFVDNINLIASHCRSKTDILTKISDFIDPAVTRTVNLNDIKTMTIGNTFADMAFITGIYGGLFLTIHCFGK